MDAIPPADTAHSSFMSSIDHAAAWLVGRIASIEASLSSLTEGSPLVADAIAAGEGFAAMHGVPIATVANVGAVVLNSARDLAAALSANPVSNASKV